MVLFTLDSWPLCLLTSIGQKLVEPMNTLVDFVHELRKTKSLSISQLRPMQKRFSIYVLIAVLSLVLLENVVGFVGERRPGGRPAQEHRDPSNTRWLRTRQKKNKAALQ